MFICEIFFHTDAPLMEAIELFAPLLETRIGDDFRQYYRRDIGLFAYSREGGLSITLSRNVGFGKWGDDRGSFRYNFCYTDEEQPCDDSDSLQCMAQVIESLWQRGVPTCTPGMGDELPCGGGEFGPVPWP